MRKPKGRMRSERGQKIMKDHMKEEHNRRANMMYLRNKGVANEGGRRVKSNSQRTKQSSIENNISRHKDTFMMKENLHALPRGPNKSNPSVGFMSNEIKQYASLKLKLKNIKHTECGDGVSLKEKTPILRGSKDDWISASGTSMDQVPLKRQPNSKDVQHSPLEMSINGPRRPEFKAMEGLAPKENNVDEVTKCKVGLPREMEGSASVQRMEGLIHKAKDVDGSSTDNVVVSQRSKGRSRSCQGKGIAEVFQRLRASSSKVMKSTQKCLEIYEDEDGGVVDKNHMGVEEVNNLACVNFDNNVVVQLENLACGAIEQRETKQDIKPNDGDQNLVDVKDYNGEDMRIGFPTKMNYDATNDRCVHRLMFFDGKTHDVKSKGRKESMQEKTYATLGGGGGDDDCSSEEVMRPTCGSRKRRRRMIVSSEDEEIDAYGVDHDCVGVESKVREESKAEIVSWKDCDAKVSMPFTAQCVKLQCNCCSKPIDEPVWWGTLKIDGKEYTSLVGHLSTKSCEKVWELSRSLQTSIELMKLSGSKVRSKLWDSSKPSNDNIGLYLLPHEMRNETNLDQLINEVEENDLVLRAVIGEAEMLIFPSCLLPERYTTFRRKHYLWALFKRREDNFNATLKPLNGTTCCAQEEEKEKEHVSSQQDDVDNAEPNQEIILMKSVMPLESQRLVNLHLCMKKQALEGMDHSVNCESPAEDTQQVSASCGPCATDIGLQLNTPDEGKQEDARRHSVHVAEATTAATNSPVAFVEATAHATNAANIPANHEQINSSMGVTLGRILFVAVKTTRVEQILQELVREGSLEFVKPAELIGAEPGPGSVATPSNSESSIKVI